MILGFKASPSFTSSLKKIRIVPPAFIEKTIGKIVILNFDRMLKGYVEGL